MGLFLTNVTVHQPGAGVVSLEGDDDEAVLRQQHNVSARGIVQFQVELIRGV